MRITSPVSRIGALLALLLCLASGGAAAQAWPERPVRVIVPYGAGTPPDYLVRLVTGRLTQSLGQAVVVENRPGANALIGMQAGAKSPADGYTVIYAGLAAMAINPSVYANLPYDPEKDFDPVVMAFSTALYVLVGGKSPYKTLGDLLAAARTPGRSLNYGSLGSGSEAHLAMEDFRTRANFQMAHVPFKGGDFVPALIRGDVDAMFLGIGSVSGLVNQGQLRALATGAPQRAAAFPDIPTVAEAAKVEGFTASAWGAFVVPARTRAAITSRLNAEINTVLALSDLKAELAKIDFVSIGGAPDAVTRTIRADTARFAQVVKVTGTKLD